MLSDTMMLGGGRKAAYSLENSLLFRGAQYLGRTPGAVGDRDKWTLSLHVRRAALGSYQYIYSAGPNPTTNEDFIGFDSGDRLNVRINGVTRLVSTQVFRDPTAWGHLVVAFDAANAVSSLKLRVYWNGAEITGWSTDSRAAILPGVAQTNTLNPHRLGNNVADNNGYFSGYLAEACLVDGAALGPSHFGEFDVVTGNWAPKRVTLNTQLPTYRGNLVPRMTGYTAPSGKVSSGFSTTSETSNDGSSDAWRAFNQSSDPTDGWQTTAGVGWISYAPAVPVIVSAYSIRVTSTDPDNRSPKSWTFEGYNGSAWVVLDTQSDVPEWKGQERRLYTFSNGTAYSSYRLNINALQGGATIVSIKAIEFFSSVETSPYGTNGFHLGTPFVKDNMGRDYSGLSGASFLVKPSGSAASLSADGLTWAYGGVNSYARGAHAFDAASATGVRFSFKFVSGTSQGAMVGICAANIVGATPSLSGEMYSYRFYNGQICGDGGYASRPGSISFSTGDVLDVVVQAGALYFYRNGTKLDGGLANGAWKTGLSGHWCPFVDRDSQVAISVQFNAGAVAWDYTIETTASGVVGGNDWMPNGFAASDVVADSPTNVYPTWNPLDNVVALTDGALKATGISGTAINVRAGLWFDVAAPTGWYWEFASVGGRVVEGAIGIAPQDYAINNTASSGAAGLMSKVAVYAPNGSKYGRGADVAYGSDWSNGAIVAVAVKSGKVWFGLVSGGAVAWQGGGDPVAGVNPAYSGLTGYWAPFMYSATSGVGGTINFGQRAFSGACPAGFKALCTANLPTPVSAAAKQPGKYYSCQVVTHNGSNTAVALGWDASATDWLARVKKLSTGSWYYIDTKRGLEKHLRCDQAYGASAEVEDANRITGRSPSGFNLGSGFAEDTYLVEVWRVAPEAGFDIVLYSGTGAVRAISHNNGTVPAFVEIKGRTGVVGGAQNWRVYHQSVGATQALLLSSPAAASTSKTYWNDTAPVSSQITLGTDTGVNASDGTYVAYVWSEVPGFSAFGKWDGNGSIDGPYVHLGFSPASLVTKMTNNSTDWENYNVAQNKGNPTLSVMALNKDAAPSSTPGKIDFGAHGVKIRSNNTDSQINTPGGTVVYAAFVRTASGAKGITPATAR